MLRKYIEDNKLKYEDSLFPINSIVANRYLKRLARRLFGDKVSLAGNKYSQLTLYDFRHISTCYWLTRYKSESALKYRFGWKKSDKIHYYSEFLGMRDTISEDDLLVDITKTEIERKLEKSEQEKMVLQERMSQMEEKLAKVMDLTNEVFGKMNQNMV